MWLLPFRSHCSAFCWMFDVDEGGAVTSSRFSRGAGIMDEMKLIGRYIEPNPNRPGLGEAHLAHYGVSVWALVAYLEAALAYYRRHQNPIDARISASAA